MPFVLQAPAQAGDKWNPGRLPGAPLRVIDAASGRPVKLAVVDEASGDAIRSPGRRVEAGPGADELVRWRLEKGTQEGARGAGQ